MAIAPGGEIATEYRRILNPTLSRKKNKKKLKKKNRISQYQLLFYAAG